MYWYIVTAGEYLFDFLIISYVVIFQMQWKKSQSKNDTKENEYNSIQIKFPFHPCFKTDIDHWNRLHRDG